MDGWSTPRRASAMGAFVAGLLALALIVNLLSPWARAVVLFSDVIVLDSPVRPLTWVTGSPERFWLEWGEDGLGQLTVPAGDRPAPTLILMLGARPAGHDDPRVVRLTDALARTGFAVLLPISAPLERGIIAPEEVDRLVEAVLAATEHPRASDEAIVIVGLSVGGTLSLLAATDERLAERLNVVLALGPYYEAATVIAQAASGSVRTVDGTERPWEVNQTTRWVLLASLRAIPPSGDATADAAVDRLIAGVDRQEQLTLAEAEAAIGQLSDGQRRWLAEISLRGRLQEIRTTWFLMHDYGDDLIPYEESDRIASERRPDRDLRIDLFDHVTPDPGNLRVLLRDGARLINVFAGVISATQTP